MEKRSIMPHIPFVGRCVIEHVPQDPLDRLRSIAESGPGYCQSGLSDIHHTEVPKSLFEEAIHQARASAAAIDNPGINGADMA
jgi:hypothetical protein